MTTKTQPELDGLAPRELIVSGDDLAPTIARIVSKGGRVEATDVVPGRHGLWRLSIVWIRGRTLPYCGGEGRATPHVTRFLTRPF